MDAAFRQLRAQPASGSPAFDDFRRILVPGYPYSIVYRLRGRDIWLWQSLTRSASQDTG
ncbi:MAG: hypothetical protein ABI305_06560 [Tepidiformaceae bacterium]